MSGVMSGGVRGAVRCRRVHLIMEKVGLLELWIKLLAYIHHDLGKRKRLRI